VAPPCSLAFGVFARAQKHMVQKEHYTFGDTDLAARRLALLARVFEPSSLRLMAALPPVTGGVGLDFGCGPGHTTHLLAQHLALDHVIGLDQSEKLLEIANRTSTDSRLAFAHCDVTRVPLPVPAADLLYARFLLTHLREPARVVRAWSSVARPGATLVLEETAAMTAEHPAFSRYYALVERMQVHYGQRMYIGRDLTALAREAAPEWLVEYTQIANSELPAADMARLHSMNLQTWSHDAFARANYDSRELAELSAALGRIASGEENAAPVLLGMGQAVLRRVEFG
jgi:trans-aconitate 2-methyltransferase